VRGGPASGGAFNGAVRGGPASGDVPLGVVPAGDAPLGVVPAGDVPLGVVPSGDVALGGVALGGVPFGGVPLGGVPFGGVPLGGVPFGGVPFGGVPFGGVPEGGSFADFLCLGGLGRARHRPPSLKHAHPQGTHLSSRATSHKAHPNMMSRQTNIGKDRIDAVGTASLIWSTYQRRFVFDEFAP
jgi:hypothetical protein